MNIKSSVPKVSIKLYRNGRLVGYHSGTNYKRFFSSKRARTCEIFDVFVSYGKSFNAFGKYVNFTNSGTYDNIEDAIYMLKAFLE